MISIYENSPNPIGLGSMKILRGPRTPHPLQNTRTPMAVRIYSSSATSLLPRLWLGLRLKLRLYFSPGMIVTLRLDHSGAWLGFTICAFSVMHFFFSSQALGRRLWNTTFIKKHPACRTGLAGFFFEERTLHLLCRTIDGEWRFSELISFSSLLFLTAARCPTTRMSPRGEVRVRGRRRGQDAIGKQLAGATEAEGELVAWNPLGPARERGLVLEDVLAESAVTSYIPGRFVNSRNGRRERGMAGRGPVIRGGGGR